MSEPYSSNQRGQIEASAPDFNANALVAVGVIVAGLYLARDVLVPFVIAVLLSFVLAMPVRWLQALGLGRRFPVAIVVMTAFLTIFLVLTVLTSQLTELASDLPRYQMTIREKLGSLKTAASGHGPLERLADMLQGLSDEFGGGSRGEEKPARPGEDQAPKPIPVEVTNVRTSPLTTISSFVAPVLHPLATTGLIVIFTIFILLARNDLRNRAIRLAGSHDLQRTTAAMNDAASRLSRFFLVQVLLNGSFGVAVGFGLWAIGVPSPILWGIMAAISRFVPYVGVVMAAGGPLVLAAAVDPHWTMLIATAAFFAATEFLVGQVIEPLVYGHSTGLSPVAVIASVTFWTWLWGPVGLILATPLTVCLVVLGRHVDRLEFLDVMLGDRPPLTAAETFYQRALAGDAGETIEQAEVFLRDHTVATFYDEIAVRGLALAQADLARGALDSARLERIRDTVTELVEDLSEHEDEVPGQATTRTDVKRAAGDEELDSDLDRADRAAMALPSADAWPLDETWRREGAILCVAGRNELDRGGAMMLAQLLGKHGLGTRVEDAGMVTAVGSGRLSASPSRIVCLFYLDTSVPVHVRFAVRRIRRHLPHARIVVCSWGIEPGSNRSFRDLVRSDVCANRLIETVQICLDIARGEGAEENETGAPKGVSRHGAEADAA